MDIDITKLQQLNDRIAQTIDVLNHLRATTFGLSHSANLGPWSHLPQVGMHSNPWGVAGINQAWNQGWNVNPFGQVGVSPFANHGLRHAADPFGYGMANPFGLNQGYGVNQGYGGVNQGYGAQSAVGPFGNQGAYGMPYGMLNQGLSHAGMIDPRLSVGIDPRLMGNPLANTMRPFTPFPTFGFGY